MSRLIQGFLDELFLSCWHEIMNAKVANGFRLQTEIVNIIAREVLQC